MHDFDLLEMIKAVQLLQWDGSLLSDEDLDVLKKARAALTKCYQWSNGSLAVLYSC